MTCSDYDLWLMSVGIEAARGRIVLTWVMMWSSNKILQRYTAALANRSNLHTIVTR